MRRKSQLSLSVLIVTEKDGNGFHSFAPALKGLHVDGSTQDEALENAKNAIHVYLESLSKHNDPLPVGPYFKVKDEFEMAEVPEDAFIGRVEVQWPSQRVYGTS